MKLTTAALSAAVLAGAVAVTGCGSAAPAKTVTGHHHHTIAVNKTTAGGWGLGGSPTPREADAFMCETWRIGKFETAAGQRRDGAGLIYSELQANSEALTPKLAVDMIAATQNWQPGRLSAETRKVNRDCRAVEYGQLP